MEESQKQLISKQALTHIKLLPKQGQKETVLKHDRNIHEDQQL